MRGNHTRNQKAPDSLRQAIRCPQNHFPGEACARAHGRSEGLLRAKRSALDRRCPRGPSPAAGTPRRSGASGRLVGASLAGDRADTTFADAAQVKPCWCRSQRGASGERRLSPIGRAHEVAAPRRAPSYTGLWGISQGLSTANSCPGPTAQRCLPRDSIQHSLGRVAAAWARLQREAPFLGPPLPREPGLRGPHRGWGRKGQ